MSNEKSWFRRHWVLTGVLGLAILIIGFSVLRNTLDLNNGIEKVDNSTSESASNPTTSEPIQPSKVYTNKNEGYTLSIKGYKFEKKTDAWGILREITVAMDNAQGSNDIFPSLDIVIKNVKPNEKIIPNEKVVDMSEWLYSGSSIERTLQVDISLATINETKNVNVCLIEKYGRACVCTDFNTNLLEGFK